jgi:hypothetical protein
MLLQWFLNYNLPDGLYLTASPIVTANWNADKGGDVLLDRSMDRSGSFGFNCSFCFPSEKVAWVG